MRVSARAVLLFVLGAGLSACGAPPCRSSASCTEGLVCGFDGRCGTMEDEARFTGARWLMARDWAIAGEGPRGSTLPIGGGAEGLLAFGPLPADSAIHRALLVLHPIDARVERGGEIVVERVEGFTGGQLPARRTATALAFAAARSALPAGPARPVRIDLTELTKDAATRGDRTLHVLLRLSEGAPSGAHFASPWAIGDRVQPRLELILH